MAESLDSGLRQAHTSTSQVHVSLQNEGSPSKAQRGFSGEGCRVLTTDLDESCPPGDGLSILAEDTRAGWFGHDLLGAQAAITGDMNLLGATLDITYNGSRVGWFGRGLSLEEPV